MTTNSDSSRAKNQPSDRPDRKSNVRMSRMLSTSQLTAIGLTVTIGLGVYSILGAFVEYYPTRSIQASFVLLALIAVPIVLTLADIAGATRGSGAYGLVRGQQWLLLPYMAGWLLIGGYAAILALLGLGLGVHLNSLIAPLDIESLDLASAIGILAVYGIFKILGSAFSWRRSTVIVAGATLTAFILAGAGLLVEPAGRNLPRFLTQDALQVDVSVMPTTTLLGATLWGILMIVELRGASHNRLRLRRAMLATVLILLVVAGTAALAIDRYIGRFEQPLAPLLTFARAGVTPAPALFRLAYLLLGGVLMLMGLDLIYTNTIRLIESMAEDGFVPHRLESRLGRAGTPLLPVLGTTLLAILLIHFLNVLEVLAVGSIFFFWTAAALCVPAALARPDSSLARAGKLPYHPLFPGFVIAAGAFLPLTLGRMGLPWAFLWIGLGLLLFFGYARRSGVKERRSDVLDSESLTESGLTESGAPAAASTAAAQPPADNAVLVAIANPKNSAGLINLGARLADARGAGLIVLRVLRVPSQTAFDVRRKLVQREIDLLQETLAEIETGGVPVRPVVRLGVSPADGILDVIDNERVSLLVIGWSGNMASEETAADPLVDLLVRSAPCDVLVLRGQIPEQLERVTVATAGGPHSMLATELAYALGADDDYHLRLLHVLPPDSTTEEKQTGNAALSACAAMVDENAVEQEMIGAESIEAGIVKGAEGADVLIMGAAKANAFMRSRFRGMPVKIAANMARPVIIARAKEEIQHPTIARGLELVSDPLPTLTEERRKEVALHMVDSAVPSVDFYVLIILAAMIASLGLLQNSAAVIIGAMLVAPLMSPILAMAMGIVRGDLDLLKMASEATAKGVFMAIAVGIAMVIISPINGPTSEILARTQPNVLDLMVALASGAAAGYAVSRSQVAAALPGVAIAAALVPPLCVVGYGIGTSQLNYAAGALLLFTTNLVAIVLAAALIFLALGFYPRDTGRQELWQRLRTPILLMAGITAILVATTVFTVRDANARAEIERILMDAIEEKGGALQDLAIDRRENRYDIRATLILTDPAAWTQEAVAEIEASLNETVKRSTSFEALVQNAQAFDEQSYAEFRTVSAYLTKEVTDRGGRMTDLVIFEDLRGIRVGMTVVMPPDGQLDKAAMESIRRGLEAELYGEASGDGGRQHVRLEATMLLGDVADLRPPAIE